MRPTPKYPNNLPNNLSSNSQNSRLEPRSCVYCRNFADLPMLMRSHTLMDMAPPGFYNETGVNCTCDSHPQDSVSRSALSKRRTDAALKPMASNIFDEQSQFSSRLTDLLIRNILISTATGLVIAIAIMLVNMST